MLLSKEVEPTDQLVKSLIDQAHMKFQAVNKEQLAKKNARTRGIPENSVGVTQSQAYLVMGFTVKFISQSCQVYLSDVKFTSALLNNFSTVKLFQYIISYPGPG